MHETLGEGGTIEGVYFMYQDACNNLNTVLDHLRSRLPAPLEIRTRQEDIIYFQDGTRLNVIREDEIQDAEQEDGVKYE